MSRILQKMLAYETNGRLPVRKIFLWNENFCKLFFEKICDELFFSFFAPYFLNYIEKYVFYPPPLQYIPRSIKSKSILLTFFACTINILFQKPPLKMKKKIKGKEGLKPQIPHPLVRVWTLVYSEKLIMSQLIIVCLNYSGK